MNNIKIKNLLEAFDFNKVKIDKKKLLKNGFDNIYNNMLSSYLINELKNSKANKQVLCYNAKEKLYYITEDSINNYIIAVCVGKGLWAPVKWSGLINEYSWVDLTLDENMPHNIKYGNISKIDGISNTYEILNNSKYSKYIKNSIWDNIREFKTIGIPKGCVYLPAADLLYEIYNNISNDNVNSYLYRFLDEDMLEEDKMYWGSSVGNDGGKYITSACALSLKALLKKLLYRYGVISYEDIFKSINPYLDPKYEYNSMVLLNIDEFEKLIKRKG